MSLGKDDEFDLLAGHELGQLHGATEKAREEDPEALNTLIWHKIHATGYQPSSREGHSLVTNGSNAVMFGGFEAGRRVNSVAVLDVAAGGQWSLIQPNGQVPTPRCYHAAVCHAGVMLVHGGEGFLPAPELEEVVTAAAEKFSSPQLERDLSGVQVVSDEDDEDEPLKKTAIALEESQYSIHDRLHQKESKHQTRRRSELLRNKQNTTTGVTLGDTLTSSALHPTPKIIRDRTATADVISEQQEVHCLDDLYALDTMFMEWFRIDSILAPLARKGHTLNTAHLEGEEETMLLLFGGHSIDNHTLSNSIHVCSFNSITNAIQTQKQQVQVMNSKKNTGNHVDVIKSLRHTSSKAQSKPVWRTLECAGTPPSPRFRHTATVINRWDDPPGEILAGMDAYASLGSNAIMQSASLLIIIGGVGNDPTTSLNDVHILNLDTLQWTTPVSGVDALGRGLAGEGPRHGIAGHTAVAIKTARNLNRIQPLATYSQEVNPATVYHGGRAGGSGVHTPRQYLGYTARKRIEKEQEERQQKDAELQHDKKIRDMQRQLAYKAFRQPPKPDVCNDNKAAQDETSIVPSHASMESHFSGEMEILIFGGTSTPLDNTHNHASIIYVYNFENNSWRHIKTGHKYPPPRINHAVSVIHGWAPMNMPPTALPTSQLKHQVENTLHFAHSSSGCLILFGGMSNTAECIADTWTLDLQWRNGGVTQYDTSNYRREQYLIHNYTTTITNNDENLGISYEEFKSSNNYPIYDNAADGVTHPDRALEKLHGLNHQRYLVAAISGQNQPLSAHLDTAKNLRIRDVMSYQQEQQASTEMWERRKSKLQKYRRKEGSSPKRSPSQTNYRKLSHGNVSPSRNDTNPNFEMFGGEVNEDERFDTNPSVMQQSTSTPLLFNNNTGVGSNHWQQQDQQKQQAQIEKTILQLRKERAQSDMLLKKEKNKSIAIIKENEQLQQELKVLKESLAQHQQLHEHEMTSLQESLRASLARETYLKQLNEEAHHLLFLYGINNI